MHRKERDQAVSLRHQRRDASERAALQRSNADDARHDGTVAGTGNEPQPSVVRSQLGPRRIHLQDSWLRERGGEWECTAARSSASTTPPTLLGGRSGQSDSDPADWQTRAQDLTKQRAALNCPLKPQWKRPDGGFCLLLHQRSCRCTCIFTAFAVRIYSDPPVFLRDVGRKCAMQ